ncbi:bifunctional lysylphosphatidylglycerol flippase/synthetase MprF [Streptomyces alkaliterrae]|uniref:DUF2156 domain-containing protein n=1 Tax=Streptomyces alkaliterrae TaxID=2213162 RepID=A0A5P0YQG0_9ACTN|nr:DUF2156 domain-containing protein [Streptomyces alkaliterrae]MBB1258473.1 DUF2156 domain-containing protein [Streptomyces alkaliterrae]MQS02554.1 DUF2156 domain-containing protein [Streptomyces alkaliterrae]
MTVATANNDQILDAIRRHTQADNPSAFLAVNEETSRFVQPDLDGAVCYRAAGGFLVQFGGPFAADADRVELLRRFLEFAREQDRTVVGVQLARYDAELYVEHGFTVNQVGASYAVDLAEHTLRGTRFMQLRNKISRSFRAGLVVEEVDATEHRDAVAEIDAAWLGTKGEHARPLEFLVGQTGGWAQQHRRLFLGSIEGRPTGYISYSPVYGTRAGWMHDLSRRLPGGPPGVMEAINATAIEKFSAEGAGWLHFGFTPFTGLAEEHELPGRSSAFQWFMHHLWEHGEAVYPARTQLSYKEKWAPHTVLPEYVAFQGSADLGAFAHVFRAANAF